MAKEKDLSTRVVPTLGGITAPKSIWDMGWNEIVPGAAVFLSRMRLILVL